MPGESTLMVGADSKAAFEKAEPIIRTMAGHAFYMGKLGNGHAMKTLNNCIMASSIRALSDSLVTRVEKHTQVPTFKTSMGKSTVWTPSR